jgi:co-chaperonin GroES (HSP10)
MTIVPGPEYVLILYDDIYADKTPRKKLRGIVVAVGEEATEIELNRAVMFEPTTGSKIVTETGRFHIIKKDYIDGYTT